MTAYQKPLPLASPLLWTAIIIPVTRFGNALDPKPPALRKPVDASAAIVVGPRLRDRVPIRFKLSPSRRTAERHRIGPPLVAFSQKPLVPHLDVALSKPVPPPEPKSEIRPKRRSDAHHIDLSAHRLREIWRDAPGDLKLVTLIIPLLLLLIVNLAGPRMHRKPVVIKASTEPVIDGVITKQWNAFRHTISARAGYEYSDDFRSGLDAWQTRSGVPPNWSYDSTGFLHPGVLALYRPTLQSSDYRFEFLTRLEQRGMGAVFRASDTENYYAIKLIAVRQGAMTEIHTVRYTVMRGREGPRVEKRVADVPNPDTFLRATVDVRGADFTLMVQDKLADFWTDDRLKTGGVGFFCAKGEQARLRWVSVTHQYDTLGRLCAYLAPYSVQKNGS